MTDRSMSPAICVFWPWQSPFSFLPTDFPYFLKPKHGSLVQPYPPPPNCAVPLSLLFWSSSPSSLCFCTRKFLCKSFIKGVGWEWGCRERRRGLSWGWLSWIPHHSNWQTFTKHWGISSYQLDYWSLRERLLNETNAGYHQDPGRSWSPTAISSFLHFFFFWSDWGSCLLPAYSPLQFHSSLVPSLFPLFPLLSFSKKESLCITPFLAPLCYAVHIVTQWKAESLLWVWSSENSSVP